MHIYNIVIYINISIIHNNNANIHINIAIIHKNNPNIYMNIGVICLNNRNIIGFNINIKFFFALYYKPYFFFSTISMVMVLFSPFSFSISILAVPAFLATHCQVVVLFSVLGFL